MSDHYDFLIAGAGIFGLSTAIELRKRKYSVGLLNPDTIPHPLAASTDISKVVRMEYGTDEEYMEMAAYCMDGWRSWNHLFGEELYHEVGFILATRNHFSEQGDTFEAASYRKLLQKGYNPIRLNGNIDAFFPAFNPQVYPDGFYNPTAGFVESGRIIKKLVDYAEQLGVVIHQGQTAQVLERAGGRCTAVSTREGARFEAGHVVVCAGVFTPWLLPELQPYMKATGHPVFHLRPSNPELFTYPRFAVFAADISNTGWYGFPVHPTEGVVKIANHGVGVTLHPENDARVVNEEDERKLRSFLRESLPALADDPIVYTRRCLYTDTLDGHFWIDRHPGIEGLTVGTGGSGHALKMGPVLGELIADAAEGRTHRWSARYRWRHIESGKTQEEEARFKGD